MSRRGRYGGYGRRGGYSRYDRYVSMDERRNIAAAEVAKRRKKGQVLQPVEIEGRTIARTFWGRAWCDNLEAYSDYSNRLPRGRRYARNGSILDLQVEAGEVTALVMGSSLYEVTIGIKPLAKARWAAIRGDCAGQIDSVVELLQGALSEGVMEVVTKKGQGLFPAPREIDLACTCPDWATMCKHVAAVLYGVGARLDHAPELLFTLRGVDPQELIEDIISRGISQRGRPSGQVLEGADLSEIFGVEIDFGAEVVPVGRGKVGTGKTSRAKGKGRAAKASRGKGKAEQGRPQAGKRTSGQGTAKAAGATARAKNSSGRSSRSGSGSADPGLTGAAIRVLRLVTGESGLRSPQVAERLGLPRSVAVNALGQLRRRGLVVFVGSKRSGGYEVVE